MAKGRIYSFRWREAEHSSPSEVQTASLVHDEAGTAGAVPLGRLRSWVHPIVVGTRRTLSSCLCGFGRRYGMMGGRSGSILGRMMMQGEATIESFPSYPCQEPSTNILLKLLFCTNGPEARYSSWQRLAQGNV